MDIYGLTIFELIIEIVIFLVLTLIAKFLFKKMKNSSNRYLNPTEFLPEDEVHTLRQVFYLVLMSCFLITIFYSLTFSESDVFYLAIFDIFISLVAVMLLDESLFKNKILWLLIVPYGSLSFKAPELILNKNYDFKVDIWALGISLYYIIYKTLPFEGGSRDEIKKGIVNNPVIFYENDILSNSSYYNGLITDNIDKDSKEFQSSIIYSILKDCLVKNPKERFSIDELYNKYYEIIKNLV